VKVMMPIWPKSRTSAFQHGIDRHDQRLDHVVQHVQTLIAASTATTVPSLPLPREGAAAVLLPPTVAS
jgi:hypothetical protein